MKLQVFITVPFILLLNFCLVFSSDGDRSPFYQNCVKNCLSANCTKNGETYKMRSNEQQFTWTIVLWGCRDECRYECMWRTVHAFEERGYQIPKFHGKWPFIRILGVQEPASAFASVLNLAAHIYKHSEITRRFSSNNVPLVMFWHVFAAVCMNAWVWSTIFHTRDTPFTEFMDYACALSMVMALFISAVVRVFHKRRKLTAIFLTFPLLYYVEHVRYLYSGRIDYDYNMLVNIFFGTAGSVMWVWWSGAQYCSGRRHAWRVALFAALSGAALTLELLDFPPVARLWDAHALWHLATAPLPLLFYRFVIDDLYYLQNSEKAGYKLA